MILRTEMKTVQKCTYNYSNADVIGMKSYMRRIKWNKELRNKNIEEMWCTFSSILNKCRNKYVPKKTGKRKKKQCGWTVQHMKHKKENIPNMTYTRR